MTAVWCHRRVSDNSLCQLRVRVANIPIASTTLSLTVPDLSPTTGTIVFLTDEDIKVSLDPLSPKLHHQEPI